MNIENPEDNRSNTSQNRIDYLKNSLDYNFQIIQFLDTKSHLIIITIVVFIPLISNQLLGSTWEKENLVIKICSILALISLTSSFIFSILVALSRTPKAPKTHFFGLDILPQTKTSRESKKAREIFKNQINDLDDSMIVSDYCDLIYTFGVIMKQKFKCMKLANICLVGGITLSIGVIIISQLV
jgi:hypothetical protein